MEDDYGLLHSKYPIKMKLDGRVKVTLLYSLVNRFHEKHFILI